MKQYSKRAFKLGQNKKQRKNCEQKCDLKKMYNITVYIKVTEIITKQLCIHYTCYRKQHFYPTYIGETDYHSIAKAKESCLSSGLTTYQRCVNCWK